MKLGIALPDLGASQISYQFILSTNQFLSKRYDCDIVCFYEMPNKKSVRTNFCCLQTVEMWGYDAPIVACSLNSAQDLLSNPTSRDKYFYIWDLEWVHLDDKHYDKLKKIYSNPELKIITRNEDYAKIMKKAWGTQAIGVVEDFDMEKMVKIVWNKN
jgi:hypothetical protein